MTRFTVFLLLAGFGGVLFALIQWGGIQGYTYRLEPDGIHIWQWGIVPGRFIAYSSILEARRATVGETLRGRRYGLLFWRGVRLQVEGGLFPVVILTPSTPDAFLTALRQHLPPRIRL